MGTLTLQSIPQQLPGVIRLRLAFLEGFARRPSEINRDTRGNYFFGFSGFCVKPGSEFAPPRRRGRGENHLKISNRTSPL